MIKLTIEEIEKLGKKFNYDIEIVNNNPFKINIYQGNGDYLIEFNSEDHFLYWLMGIVCCRDLRADLESFKYIHLQ